jgi:hypothetical protein
MHSIGKMGGVCPNVSYLLMVPDGYGTARLANIELVASYTFQAIYSAAVKHGIVKSL